MINIYSCINWVKTGSKSLLVPYILLILTACQSAVVADEIPASKQNTDAQPSKKIAKDGQVLIRHAGDAWSRQKIRNYLTENKLNLNTSPGTSTHVPDNMCAKIQPDLHNLNFKFITPDIITDDWNDPRLNKYKQKYKKFKYGMGYLVNQSPDDAAIPRWNINVYNLDTDGDGVVEAILYGERLTNSGLGSPSVSYLVFESNAKWTRGGGLRNDPSSPYWGKDNYIFSAIIKIQDIYAILVINDFSAPGLRKHEFYYAQVYLISEQNKQRRGAYDSYRCHYNFSSVGNSEFK